MLGAEHQPYSDPIMPSDPSYVSRPQEGDLRTSGDSRRTNLKSSPTHGIRTRPSPAFPQTCACHIIPGSVAAMRCEARRGENSKDIGPYRCHIDATRDASSARRYSAWLGIPLPESGTSVPHRAVRAVYMEVQLFQKASIYSHTQNI